MTATTIRTDSNDGHVQSRPPPICSALVCSANARRNSHGGGWRRRRRWRPARAALWALLDRHIEPGATVAIVGAGNGDDLPLRRLARRVARLDLIDLDANALARARRRTLPWTPRVRTLVEDVTGGHADEIVDRVRGATAPVGDPPKGPIGTAPYDVVISDLLATQLLYPALLDSGLESTAIDETLTQAGQPLTDAVVARMHAAAPGGIVIHIHDLLGWWHGHHEPATISALLDLAASDPEAAVVFAADCNQPYGCDPRLSSTRLGATIVETTFWRWPFAPGTDYLVCATVARGHHAKLAGRALLQAEMCNVGGGGHAGRATLEHAGENAVGPQEAGEQREHAAGS